MEIVYDPHHPKIWDRDPQPSRRRGSLF